MAERKASNIVEPPYAPLMVRVIHQEVICLLSSHLKGMVIYSKSNYNVSVPVLLVAALPIAVGRESCCSETDGET